MTSKLDTLLIGIIKPYNFYYRHFLLRSLVSEIFAGPFHQAKVASSSFPVVLFLTVSLDLHAFKGQRPRLKRYWVERKKIVLL